MKTIILNTSPRKNWNTAKLLKSATEGAISTGAEVEYIDLYDFWFKAIKQDVKQVISNIQATDDSKEYSINNVRVDAASIKERLSSLTEQNINYCTEQILKSKQINIFENYVIASLYNSTKSKNYEFNYNWLED